MSTAHMLHSSERVMLSGSFARVGRHEAFEQSHDLRPLNSVLNVCGG